MTLEPSPNVPQTLAGEVLGLDGSKAWPVLAEPRDRLTVWTVSGPDMVGLHLDADALQAFMALLADAAQRMKG